ncbi:hypothetical protein [Trichlorobacter lovleyi]|uniref:hypothetical protein n=1 Tax=Trichlorobacter lovleyi TaxID=313985 RepID=UPI0023F03895|nr:hypothetical protein [Trichlorobacter lovleyi]
MKAVYKVDKPVLLQNEKGTAARPNCTCGTWIDHWENLSGLKAGHCSVAGCEKEGTVGAHITRPNAKNEAYKTHSYIVPMCKDHNGKHGEKLTSKSGVTFVWANIKETCGK